jgi:elongation factor P--beta-lysine ligase
VGGCLSETTTIAAKFLQHLADRYSGDAQADPLLNASKEYKRMKDLANSFTTIFPFAMDGKIERKQRQKGAKILRDIFPHKKSAIDQLKQAIDVWD